MYYIQAPIGSDKEFAATYNGDGKKIRNVFPESEDKDIGLFGKAKTLQNINYILPVSKGLEIATSNSEVALGILAGKAGTLDNCTITAVGPTTVTMSYPLVSKGISAGGMAGDVDGSATRCKLVGGTNLTLVFTDVGFCGGLFGKANKDGSTVSDCEVSLAKLSVTHSKSVKFDTYAGGLVGQAGHVRQAGSTKNPGAAVESCTVDITTMSVTDNINDGTYGVYAGGLAGSAYSTDGVSNSAAAVQTMSVEAAKNCHYRVGGLVGADIGKISGCSAEADITMVYNTTSSKASVGGLVGLVKDGTIENSYAVGRIARKNAVGADGQNVTGNGDVGGLIGTANSTTVTNCYAAVDVTNKGNKVAQNVGGLFGSISTTPGDCYWLSGKLTYHGEEFETLEKHMSAARWTAEKGLGRTPTALEGALPTLNKVTDGSAFPYLTGVMRGGKYVHIGEYPKPVESIATASVFYGGKR